MGKELSEMTLEELWELFPIFLVAHDDRWEDRFNRSAKKAIIGKEGLCTKENNKSTVTIREERITAEDMDGYRTGAAAERK